MFQIENRHGTLVIASRDNHRSYDVDAVRAASSSSTLHMFFASMTVTNLYNALGIEKNASAEDGENPPNTFHSYT